MTMLKSFLIVALLIFVTGCAKEEGCNDPSAQNYDPFAEVNDGSCYYATGCTDPIALNYNPVADVNDGSCLYRQGCTDVSADNFDPSAILNDGSCLYFTDYFVGSYDVEEFCGDDTYFFGFNIRRHPTQPFQLYISNFGDF